MDANNGNPREAEEMEKQISEIEDKVAARKAKVKKEIKEWIVALGVALIVVFVIQTFLFRVIRVDGHSMDTTLADGERLFVTVTDVKFGTPVRNSVVICHYPHRGMTYFVKRLVAVPGDTVYRLNGVTHVVYEENGETVDLTLDSNWAKYFPEGSSLDYDAYVLGEDEYFVVGDNRYNSHDSRDWNPGDNTLGGMDGDTGNDVGPISKRMIIGRVREVIWPLGEIRSVKAEAIWG